MSKRILLHQSSSVISRKVDPLEIIRDEYRIPLKKIVTYCWKNNLLTQQQIAQIVERDISLISRKLIIREYIRQLDDHIPKNVTKRKATYASSSHP